MAGAKSSEKHKQARTSQAPKTLEEYLAKPERFQDTWVRATHVVSKMRNDNISLTAAAKEFGIDRKTVIHLVGSGLRKRSNGRYVAKPSDRFLRPLVIPTSGGIEEVFLNDSEQASLLGTYWAAVQKRLQTGDASKLRTFDGERITDINGKQIVLLTNLDELDRLGSAGVLSFESIYARTA